MSSDELIYCWGEGTTTAVAGKLGVVDLLLLAKAGSFLATFRLGLA
jgi:hypothetical protein